MTFLTNMPKIPLIVGLLLAMTVMEFQSLCRPADEAVQLVAGNDGKQVASAPAAADVEKVGQAIDDGNHDLSWNERGRVRRLRISLASALSVQVIVEVSRSLRPVEPGSRRCGPIQTLLRQRTYLLT
jgi:hypothetical protein